jgi:hypothetical protein
MDKQHMTDQQENKHLLITTPHWRFTRACGLAARQLKVMSANNKLPEVR